jgi:hypothetical protein
MSFVYERAPFEFFDVDQSGNIVGHMVESFVLEEYLKHVGRTRVYPAAIKDYSDFTCGFANTTLYTAFLKQNNPRLSITQLLAMRLRGIRRIPDICTHDEPRRTEYYEVKPNSTTGLRDGDIKLAEIDAFNQFFNLPYRPGRIWSPDFYVTFFKDTLQGIPTEMAMHIKRIKPGLIGWSVAYSRWPIIMTENDVTELWTKCFPQGMKHAGNSLVRRLKSLTGRGPILPG